MYSTSKPKKSQTGYSLEHSFYTGPKIGLSLPTLETGSRPLYYLGEYLRNVSGLTKNIYGAVSTRGKLNPHVPQPISLANKGPPCISRLQKRMTTEVGALSQGKAGMT